MSNHHQNGKQSSEVPKFILLIAKILQLISTKLTIRFAAKLFTTPIKHKIPKREWQMDQNTIQNKVLVKAINKEIVVYQYGKSTKKILLVHGWSGRGTQLVKIADELLKLGFMTISFDAPAHGKSKGNDSIMTEFIASILELEKIYGPFEFAIGHSLGGMSVLNAIKQNLKVKKAVVISSGDIIQDILEDFVRKLKLKPEFSNYLKLHFESKFGEKMENYAAFEAAKEIKIPVLILHDTHDEDVNVKAAYNIEKHLALPELVITRGLGHRKILGDKDVISRIMTFIMTS